MNSNYPNQHAVADFIARLMQEPYFLDGTLTMYADVPVKCLGYAPDYCSERENLCSAPYKYRYEALDFLVCRGSIAVAYICFNHKHEDSKLKDLFGSYLEGLDCIAHSAEALDDFELAEFYPFAARRLQEYAQDDSLRSRYADAEQKHFQPIFPVKAVDTTAAGDTFTGYFLAGLIEGMPIPEILKMSAKASSITVSREGAVPSIPYRSEV